MSDLYLLLFHDGDIHLEKTTEAQICKELEEGDLSASDFLTVFTGWANLTEIEGNVLIRGEIVTPKPVSVVTRWEL